MSKENVTLSFKFIKTKSEGAGFENTIKEIDGNKVDRATFKHKVNGRGTEFSSQKMRYILRMDEVKKFYNLLCDKLYTHGNEEIPEPTEINKKFEKEWRD